MPPSFHPSFLYPSFPPSFILPFFLHPSPPPSFLLLLFLPSPFFSSSIHLLPLLVPSLLWTIPSFIIKWIHDRKSLWNMSFLHLFMIELWDSTVCSSLCSISDKSAENINRIYIVYFVWQCLYYACKTHTQVGSQYLRTHIGRFTLIRWFKWF